jgi:hypothetical protein
MQLVSNASNPSVISVNSEPHPSESHDPQEFLVASVKGNGCAYEKSENPSNLRTSLLNFIPPSERLLAVPSSALEVVHQRLYFVVNENKTVS